MVSWGSNVLDVAHSPPVGDTVVPAMFECSLPSAPRPTKPAASRSSFHGPTKVIRPWTYGASSASSGSSVVFLRTAVNVPLRDVPAGLLARKSMAPAISLAVCRVIRSVIT